MYEIMVAVRTAILLLLVAIARAAPPAINPSLLDQAYRYMYNLDFEHAHQTLHAYEEAHPSDPIGPVSDAAAYLFSEFDRLRILQSELFIDDQRYLSFRRRPADPRVKQEFENALSRCDRIAADILRRDPNNREALFASVLRVGLHSDYLALIERRNLTALSEVKESRGLAERLLAKYPDYYDAYLAIGVENYLLSLKAAPMRWLLRATGSQVDKDRGLENLRVTASKGRYLLPYARLLLAVADLRDKNPAGAKTTLLWLAHEFPNNHLYRAELAKLN